MDEVLKKKDITFTFRMLTAGVVLFVLAMFAYAWTVDTSNYIDDQILFYNKDCNPHSVQAQNLLSDNCTMAKVYAENTRMVVFLMVVYYGIVNAIGSFFNLLLTNATYIGSSALMIGATYIVKRHLLPVQWL